MSTFTRANFCGHKGLLDIESGNVIFYGLRFNTISETRSLLEFLKPSNTYKPFMYKGVKGVINKKTGKVNIDCSEYKNIKEAKILIKNIAIK